MFIFHLIRNWYISLRYQYEIQSLISYIDSYQEKSTNPLILEANKVFFDRRDKNPGALSMTFWKNHPDLSILHDFPEISGNVLDFGAGSGNLDILSGLDITGIDLSPLAVILANQNKMTYKANDLNFFSGDIVNDIFSFSKKFDSVWSTQTFEHISDPSEIFTAIRKYTVSGAYMLITVPYQHAFEDEGHVHHFMTEKELRDHLSNWVQVQKIKLYEKHHILTALVRL